MNGIIKVNRKFRRRVYEIPLCCWSDIIGLITGKNPKLLDPFDPKFSSGPLKEGYPIKLKDDLIKLIKKIRKYNIHTFNEETTKYVIILPILEKLGWNIYDPWEVYPENPISGRKVDYILKDCKSSQICIEAKNANDEELDHHKKQIRWYCASKNVDLGILTNGLIWKFYFFNYYENSLGAIKNIKAKKIDIVKESPEKCVDKFIEFFWKGKTSKLKPKEFENITDIINKIKSINEESNFIYNESAVKQFILMPLLKNLGWNISDQSEIVYSKSINHHKIDYIIAHYSKYNFIIEVKALGYDLDYSEENVLNFALVGKFKMAILTDGNDWRFYYIKTKQNFAHKQYYGDYKFKLRTSDQKELSKLFNILLSKDKVLKGDNLKYLEKIV